MADPEDTPLWQCIKGATLLAPSGPQAGHLHLFAVLLDPVVADGRGSQPHALLACIVSVHEGILLDDSCPLGPEDHPFIKHPSYVDYRFTRLEVAADVERRVGEGVFVKKQPCSPELLRKIIAGALQSKRISLEYKGILQKVIWGE